MKMREIAVYKLAEDNYIAEYPPPPDSAPKPVTGNGFSPAAAIGELIINYSYLFNIRIVYPEDVNGAENVEKII